MDRPFLGRIKKPDDFDGIRTDVIDDAIRANEEVTKLRVAQFWNLLS
jgi:hypothetical protein